MCWLDTFVVGLMSVQGPSCGKEGLKTDRAIGHHMRQTCSGWNSQVNELIWDEICVEEEMAAEVRDYFGGTAKTYGMGYTFVRVLDAEEISVQRETNMYDLFSCKQEWEIG